MRSALLFIAVLCFVAAAFVVFGVEHTPEDRVLYDFFGWCAVGVAAYLASGYRPKDKK